MKKENVDVPEDMENPPDRQTGSEVSESKSKSAKVRKNKKEVDGVQLPVLVEFAYSVSILLLVFWGLTITGISFISGASLLNIVVRTSVAILVMGVLFMLISSQISSGVLKASLVEQEESLKAQPEESENVANIENQSTIEA